MFRRFEAWLMAKLVERRVRKALEPYVKATVQMLVGQTAEGIPAAAPATIVGLVLGAQQEAAQEATGSPLESFEAETGLDDGSEVSAADSYELAEEPVTLPEPDAAEKRAALAAVLRRPEPAQDFASMLLASRGAGWE
jgi:hypothetical protein